MKKQIKNLYKAIFWENDEIALEGFWRGGVSTSVQLSREKIIFDVGPCFLDALKADTLILSHCHSDHSFGLPYLLARRAMERRESLDIYAPETQIETLKDFIAAAQKLDGADFKYSLNQLHNQSSFHLGKDLYCKAIKADHTVDCFSFILSRERKKLKPEWQGALKKDLIEAKNQGQEINYKLQLPYFAYCTDTSIDVLDNNPELYEVPYLFLECTFPVDPESIEKAKAGKHIHFQQILDRKDKFKNKTLIFGHFSQRYHSGNLKDFTSLIQKEIKGINIELFHPAFSRQENS